MNQALLLSSSGAAKFSGAGLLSKSKVVSIFILFSLFIGFYFR